MSLGADHMTQLIPELTDPQAKIFISYSRKDLVLAERLRNLLMKENFGVAIDTEGIAPGEVWQPRLGSMIASSDIVVPLVSPDFLASDVCGWELGEAKKLGKKILPIAIRDPGPEAPSNQISHLNYLFMRSENEWSASIPALLIALQADIGWLRRQTELTSLALRWRAAGRPRLQLLFGQELESAEEWLKNKPDIISGPPDIVDDLIKASAHMRDEPEPRTVYVGYSHRDHPAAEDIAKALRRRGLKVFMDRFDLAAGAELNTQIESLIKSVDVAIFIASQNAIDSTYFREEVRLARADDKEIVVAAISDPATLDLQLIPEFTDAPLINLSAAPHSADDFDGLMSVVTGVDGWKRKGIFEGIWRWIGRR